MQKKIIALAIAAAFAAPVAMAAEGVTVYGSVDAGFNSRTSNGVTSNTMGSEVYNSNRFGIKSEEDLGDGMKATAQIETGFNTATGDAATVGSRGIGVGISSGDHAVVLGGNQYSTSFKVINTYDPLGYKFLPVTGASSIAIAGRHDSDIAYTGKFGDITVMANKAMGTAGDDSSSNAAVGATFKSGPINAGAAYSTAKPAVGSDASETQMTVGAGFNFGDGSVMAGYATLTTKGASAAFEDAKRNNMWIGASFNMSSKIGLLAGYYKTATKATVALGAVQNEATDVRMVVGGTYSLSKRTKLYAEIDRKTTNAGGAASDVGTSGYALGLSTTF
ncbi:MAG: porin [Gallionellaceae bacterium]|jgi:predicted porin